MLKLDESFEYHRQHPRTVTKFAHKTKLYQVLDDVASKGKYLCYVYVYVYISHDPPSNQNVLKNNFADLNGCARKQAKSGNTDTISETAGSTS